MAHDLILGTTTRDWSCGRLAPAPTPASGSFEETTSMDPAALAEAVRHEIATNTSRALRLHQAGRLPISDFNAYRKFHTAWIAFSGRRTGRWSAKDKLNLWNLRELNRQFSMRFAVFDKVASTPLRRPGAPEPAELDTRIAFRPPGSVADAVGHPWAILLGAGLTLGALTWLGGQKRQPSKKMI